MKGNRPIDVCALCDRPIEGTDNKFNVGYNALHLYLGPGWVHGGGRENIPVHHGCAWLGDLADREPNPPAFYDVVRSLGLRRDYIEPNCTCSLLFGDQKHHDRHCKVFDDAMDRLKAARN